MSASSAPGSPLRQRADDEGGASEHKVEAEGTIPGSDTAGMDATNRLTQGPQVVATSSVSAEAEQGDGPAAASASGSAVGESVSTNAVSVVVGPQGAAAAGPFGVVVTGPHGSAAASQVGVVSVGPQGVAAASNAANGTKVVACDGEEQAPAAGTAGDPDAR
jgi:hypothetical protein